MSDPTGRVVAELGRPETPEETAERKARNRAERRSRQTFRNLLGALVASLAIVVALVLIVPRGDGPGQRDIDVAQAVQQYGDTAGQPLVAPGVPATWKANAAELRGSGEDASWYVGYVIDGAGYAGVSEGLPGSPDMLETALGGAKATGTTRIGGLPWRVYDRRDRPDAGNVAYGLATKVGDVVLAVYGTVGADQVRTLAAEVAADAAARGVKGTGSLP